MVLLCNGCGGCCNCDNSDCRRIAILNCILGGGVMVVLVVVVGF